jgi:lipopolysaccharide export system protein LptA
VIKYLFTFIFLLTTTALMAQKKPSVVNLISSERSQGIKRNGADVIKVYRGVFQQESSTLSSDSAYFYPAINSFDAYGHVLINQGDTLNIFSDKLNYNGNTKIAILTNNVRMVDRDATLTTNYLTYNTATRIGTYTGGGKLVNKDNTLTSKNGYYFAFSRDAYFRYNVVLDTKDNIIKTDTLRYNSGSRISYFLGPTHIYGKKDKDTLYTENGTYNTQTEQAFFGKKNRYSQGTKSLKGDSLFYDGVKGFGKAINNITFIDTEQKITLKGDIGTYYKADERTVVTKNAYVVLVTEERDTTKKDTVALKPNTTAKKPSVNSNKAAVQAVPDPSKNAQPPANTMPVQSTASVTVKSVGKDTLKRNSAPAGDKGFADNNTLKNSKPVLVKAIAVKKEPEIVKRDTIYMAADTLETQILTYKALKDLQEARIKARIKDTTKKADVKGKKGPATSTVKESKILTLMPPGSRAGKDSSYLHRDYFKDYNKPKVIVAAKKQLTPAELKKRAQLDSLRKKNMKPDSVYMTGKITLSDTARIRIVSAFHKAKIFKSDLQAKADSIFFSYSDSTIRCYVNPIIWAQDSQLSGDTIYMQMKNKKLDNMDLFPAAFIVNIEGGDSTYFNQVAGKKIKGYFKEGKLERVFVDGNAETIYFMRDSGRVSNMHRSLSSRIRVNFKENKATNVMFLTKPEHRYVPVNKTTEEDKILKGFIWKPKERPVSKESIIPSFRKKTATVKKQTGQPPAARPKPGVKVSPLKATVKDTTAAGNTLKKQSVPVQKPAAKDSAAVRDTVKKTPVVTNQKKP